MFNASLVMIWAFFRIWPWDSTFESRSKMLLLYTFALFPCSMFKFEVLTFMGFEDKTLTKFGRRKIRWKWTLSKKCLPLKVKHDKVTLLNTFLEHHAMSLTLPSISWMWACLSFRWCRSLLPWRLWPRPWLGP